MLTSLGHSGHSAEVHLHLVVNGSALPIAQMGPDFLLLDAPIDHPPGEGIIVFQVDETERRWAVRLPEGLSAHSERVAIAPSR